MLKEFIYKLLSKKLVYPIITFNREELKEHFGINEFYLTAGLKQKAVLTIKWGGFTNTFAKGRKGVLQFYFEGGSITYTDVVADESWYEGPCKVQKFILNDKGVLTI